jgi:hypothetical protein
MTIEFYFAFLDHISAIYIVYLSRIEYVCRKNSLETRCEDCNGRTCSLLLHTRTDVLWFTLKRWLENVLTHAWCFFFFLTFCLVGLRYQAFCLLSTWLLLTITYLGWRFLADWFSPNLNDPARHFNVWSLVCSIFICQGINFIIVWGQCCDLVWLFTLY